MEYKVSYDREADVLTLILKNKGRLDYAEEAENIVIHYGKNKEIILIEILNASETVPKLVEALAKKEATIKI